MDLIRGFAWPLPSAFAAAVAACRFEQGDVLYSDAAAYGGWRDFVRRKGHHIQVLDPARSVRALAADAEGGRMLASWHSPVEIEITVLPRGDSERLRTTQGRLFCCLWRGDLAQLDAESAEPEPPAGARDLQRRLPEAVDAFRRRRRKATGCLYVSVLDQSSDSARVKARTISSALAARHRIEAIDLTPVEAGVPEAETFHPALLLHGLYVDSNETDTVESLLRGVLSSTGSERFSLGRHGLLVPLSSSG